VFTAKRRERTDTGASGREFVFQAPTGAASRHQSHLSVQSKAIPPHGDFYLNVLWAQEQYQFTLQRERWRGVAIACPASIRKDCPSRTLGHPQRALDSSWQDTWHARLIPALLRGFSFTPQPLYPRAEVSGTHWIEDWVSPGDGLDCMEKSRSLTPSGLELRSLGRPSRLSHRVS
jgi:hypothetical protein